MPTLRTWATWPPRAQKRKSPGATTDIVFPHNNTIQYDETAENFGINIHDVTEHTGQTIRYFTNEDTFTNGGGLSEGQIYSTSGFRKLITKVQLQTSNILEAHFRARIKTVDADRNITGDLGRSYAVNPMSTNPHSYPFFDADGNVGIVEEGNQRIAIILEGDEAGDTPRTPVWRPRK